MQTQVLGLSVDSQPCLTAWADSLGGITYPLLSDFYPHGQVSRTYGVLRPEGYSERAIFVIDKEGCIVYVDVHDIEQQPDNEEVFRVLARLQGQRLPEPAAIPAGHVAPAPVQESDVLLYCTSWCPACRRARTYLKEHSIPYKEIDITTDRDAARLVREWTGGFETTPTFNIRGTVIVDFQQEKVAKALGLEYSAGR